MTTAVKTHTSECPRCGSTNIGTHETCARCTTPLHQPPPVHVTRHRIRHALATLTLIPSLAGAGVATWQLTHHNPHTTTRNATPDKVPAPVASKPTGAPTKPSTGTADTAQSCTNQADGYTLHYPIGWVTESATPAQACHFFGPQPFPVSPGQTTAGQVTIDASTPGTYHDFIATFAHPGDASIKLRHTPTTINGHAAQRMLFTTHAGTQVLYGYGYVIDHYGRPLIIATPSTRGPSPTLQRIITAMAHTIQLR